MCFERRDVTRIEPHELGVFDVVLVLGLLYHVENPVGLLRIAHAHTRGVCVLETQVAPGLTGTVDWGSHLYPKAIVGSFAVIDETDQIAEGNPEANIVPISLVPSVETLVLVMQLVGFQRVEVLTPPPGAYEQLAHGKRVMVAGWVDGS